MWNQSLTLLIHELLFTTLKLISAGEREDFSQGEWQDTLVPVHDISGLRDLTSRISSSFFHAKPFCSFTSLSCSSGIFTYSVLNVRG